MVLNPEVATHGQRAHRGGDNRSSNRWCLYEAYSDPLAIADSIPLLKSVTTVVMRPASSRLPLAHGRRGPVNRRWTGHEGAAGTGPACCRFSDVHRGFSDLFEKHSSGAE